MAVVDIKNTLRYCNCQTSKRKQSLHFAESAESMDDVILFQEHNFTACKIHWPVQSALDM